MVYKIDENVYLIKDKYTFKEEVFLDKGRTVYCLTAANGDVIHGLLHSLPTTPRAPDRDVCGSPSPPGLPSCRKACRLGRRILRSWKRG